MGLKDYFTPKSLVYTGVFQEVQTKYRVFELDPKGLVLSDQYKTGLANKQYIQVIGLTDTEKIKKLGHDLEIDDLVLEDILNVRQRDKFEMFDRYVFGVIKVRYLKEGMIKESYMSLIMFEHLVISFHESEPEFLGLIENLLDQHVDIRLNSMDYMFYQILDILTDHMIEVNDYLKDKMEETEESILNAQTSDQETFYIIRKQLLKLKNSVYPLLDQLSDLVKKNKFISTNNLPYYDDLLDHLRRLDLELSQSRELMRHLLDLNMNNQSNRMNKIMTTLTLFSAIFIPLSFLTGFFGMNFLHFGILEYPDAITLFLVFCLSLAIVMIVLFKKAKWL